MGKVRATAAVLALMLCSGAAAAATMGRVVSIIVMDGRCQALSVGGYNFTSGCASHVENDVLSNGRTGFTFFVSSGSTVTFSGVAPQLKLSADEVIQPVDVAIWKMSPDAPSMPEHVVGQCRFTNPYKGPATVACTATGKHGEYAANFRTNGAEPARKDF